MAPSMDSLTIYDNPVYVVTVLCLMVLASYYAAKTKLGKKLGMALLVILFTAVLANLKLIPSASNAIPLYDAIFTYVAPISLFYLLLDINLQAIKKAGLPIVVLFLIGSAATFIGVMVTWLLVQPESSLGEHASIIGGMLTGTYTGGSVNFNAIALEYDFQKEGVLYAGTVAADNVITTLWMIITLALPLLMRKVWKDRQISTPLHEHDTDDYKKIDGPSLAWLLFLGIGAYLISEILGGIFANIPFILIISTLGIMMAQIRFVHKLKGSNTLGLYLIYLFLAVIGAYCELDAVIQLKAVGLTLLLLTGLTVLIHGLLTIVFGGLLFRDWDMIAVASQANIGGGTSALALAETFDRKELILPAILVGSLGNALGTYLGFMIIPML